MQITPEQYAGLRLPTRQELIDAGYPHGKAVDGIPLGDRAVEYLRTGPDIAVYLPKGNNRFDNDNEHFLVFESPDGNGYLAVWTQSSWEGNGDNHLVIARSHNGTDWDEPRFVVGVDEDGSGVQASWGFPVVTRRGRIYLFYTCGENWDNNKSGSGSMGGLYSDDCGATWSAPGRVPMPRSKYDNPDTSRMKNWIVWQKTEPDAEGRPLAFCTVVTSDAVMPAKPGSWVNMDARCFFIRFDNLDGHPEPEDVKTTWLPESEDGITVPNAIYNDIHTAQEPSLVTLPDGRLFTVMRTVTGFIYYAVSEDNGAGFSVPQVLFMEDGMPFEHPLSSCPVYRLHDGRYILLFHNNPGRRLGYNQFQRVWSSNYANFMRNPTYFSIGTFAPGEEQPLRFGPPVKLFDTGDIAVGPKKTAEVATYPSLTSKGGEDILWYPDRKFYLLGKRLTPQVLAGRP